MVSKQRSCIPCAAAKRRCVPQVPQCPRCARQGLYCQYRNEPLQTSKAFSTAASLSGSEHGSQPSLRRSRQAPMPAPPSDSSASSMSPMSVDVPQSTPYQDGDTPPFNFFDGLLAGLPPLLVPVPSRCITRRDILSGDLPTLVTVDEWAIGVLVGSISSWSRSFVRKLETPFLYPLAHGGGSLPLPLQDAFSACAGYICKTQATSHVALSVVETTVGQLVSQDPLQLTSENHLASLQAFLILHTIQLWDGDVRQRAQAELHGPQLEQWALQLHARMAAEEELEVVLEDGVRGTSGPAVPTGATPTSHSGQPQWAIRESARRTVLVTLLSQGAYETVKYGICSYVPLMAGLPFTVSTRSGRGGDLLGWNESPGICRRTVKYGDFSVDWKESDHREPLDGFAKLMLSPCLGVAYKESLSIPLEDD